MTVLILASASASRASLLRNAGVEFDVHPASIDEAALKDSLSAEGASPHDIADALAEQKALKVARKNPDRMVLGCDQILEHDGSVLSKASTISDARQQLRSLRGSTHRLYSAAVLYDREEPIWRAVTRANLTMRDFSDAFLDRYLEQNWNEVRASVGCYHVEGLGVRLFSKISGDWFTILGLPLVELLSFLVERRVLPK